ncbi:MAG: hypothetical protein Kow0037_02140 [Calditrichia bacterium]
MNKHALLIIFLMVWGFIAGYVISLDRKVKKLKEKLEFREK